MRFLTEWQPGLRLLLHSCTVFNKRRTGGIRVEVQESGRQIDTTVRAIALGLAVFSVLLMALLTDAFAQSIPAPDALRTGTRPRSRGFGLLWNWSPGVLPPGSLVGFQVYRRLEAPSFGRVGDARTSRHEPVLFYRAPRSELDAPLATTQACLIRTTPPGAEPQYVVAANVYYSVTAIVERGTAIVESPRSVELRVSASGCPDYAELELTSFQSFTVCDGTGCSRAATAAGNRGHDPVESYGHIDIEAGAGIDRSGIRIVWNCPRCREGTTGRRTPEHWISGGTGSSDRPRVPRHTTVRSNENIANFWEQKFLYQEWASGRRDSGFSQHNNRVVFPVSSRSEPVAIAWTFWDFDDLVTDDIWCQLRRSDHMPRGGEWTSAWQNFNSAPHRTDTDGNCAVQYRIRLLPRMP